MKTLVKNTQTERTLKNNDIKEVLKIAKSRGYKVFTFQSSSKYISQIFIEHSNGSVGSCSCYYSGIQFSTIHKSKRGTNLGTGFGSLVKDQDFNNPEDLDICFINSPYWLNYSGEITKNKSFQDYLNNGLGILKYYEL